MNTNYDNRENDDVFVLHDHVNEYSYCVNTFDKEYYPVQISGHIYAESEEDAIQRLIKDGIVYGGAYEFLELRIV